MIVALQGGIANQIFQAAFGLSVAETRREDVKFTRFRVDHDVKRSYGLDAFNFGLEFTDTEPTPYYHDSGRFDSNVYTADAKTFIGYWQHFGYFDNSLIRDCLALRKEPSEQTIRISEKIMGNPRSTFIHVRRGDYVKEDHTNRFHGCLPLSYYLEAIEHIKQTIPDAEFFVFSDDPEWCFENLPGLSIICHNKPGDGQRPGAEAEDLWLMSLCHHAIVANSAFSAIAAWNGGWRRNQLVVAPKRWFQEPSMADVNPSLDHWIKL